MENYDILLQTIAMTFGVAWASGINLYAVLLVLGIGGLSGEIHLPTELTVLESPMVIGAAGIMYFIEFIIDKTPGLDTGWDSLHTFIRVPAGAMLAVAMAGDVGPSFEIAAGILGASLSGASHVTKASSRLAINASPEPFSNWFASISEDIVVLAGLWAAFNHPILFLVGLVMFIGLILWLLPKLFKFIITLFRKISDFFSGHHKHNEAPISHPTETKALEQIQQPKSTGGP